MDPREVEGEGTDLDSRATREGLLTVVREHERVLEIGPFAAPVVPRTQAAYFDVLDRDTLRERALQQGQDPAGVPQIDYISPTGDLSVVTERFEAVFSSHVAEHQPDLVRHLNQVAAVLKPGGRYYILMPDMRYCFDALLAPTRITQVLTAHLEKRKVHTLESVLEHYAFTTHNDASRHWRGDSGDQAKALRTREMINAAFATFKASKGGYVDVHAWKFTPGAFRSVTQRLNRLGFTAMAPETVYETPQGRLEFAAVLRRCD